MIRRPPGSTRPAPPFPYTTRVRAGEESSEQRRLAAAAAEQLDDADPLMALDGGPERVDRLDRAADRGREADAIVGAEDVVIHRLGHGNDGHALRRDRKSTRLNSSH